MSVSSLWVKYFWKIARQRKSRFSASCVPNPEGIFLNWGGSIHNHTTPWWRKVTFNLRINLDWILSSHFPKTDSRLNQISSSCTSSLKFVLADTKLKRKEKITWPQPVNVQSTHTKAGTIEAWKFLNRQLALCSHRLVSETVTVFPRRRKLFLPAWKRVWLLTPRWRQLVSHLHSYPCRMWIYTFHVKRKSETLKPSKWRVRVSTQPYQRVPKDSKQRSTDRLPTPIPL